MDLFTPQPAKYGAEEFSLYAVPTLGLVRGLTRRNEWPLWSRYCPMAVGYLDKFHLPILNTCDITISPLRGGAVRVASWSIRVPFR